MMQQMRAAGPGLRGAVARQGGALDLRGIDPDSRLSYQRNGARQAAVCGHPVWAEPLLAEQAFRSGHAGALLAGFHSRGKAVLECLQGDFSCVVHDADSGELFLAADRLGIRPLYYADTGGQLVFGERADVVAAHPGVDDSLSAQSLYNYLYFHVVPGPASIFAQVKRLMPGQALHLRAGHVSVIDYWQPRYDESAGARPRDELKRRFLDLVRAAVTDAAERAPGPVGAFLSGGTDSSTVAGMLARHGGGNTQTYSIGFDAHGYDEMAYARLAARHFGTRHHEYYVTPADVVEAVPAIAASMDQPFGNASVVPAYYCARMAAGDGVRTMLAGDGGDELFGGNYRYAKQQMFELYSRVPGPLRRALIEPLLLGTPGTAAVPGVRKLRSYVTQARVPMPERMESYNLLRRLGAEHVLQGQWLAGADPEVPRELLRTCYRQVSAQNMIDRMLALDMRFTLADSDLPKVNGACRAAGLGVAYPWLDERLMAFSATLPAREKVRGTRLRHLFKDALHGFLPEQILSKRKQGFGLPFGIWLKNDAALGELAGESLKSLVDRGVLRTEAVDMLMGQQHEHAAYYGTFIWILMMLEQWLAGHGTEGAWS